MGQVRRAQHAMPHTLQLCGGGAGNECALQHQLLLALVPALQGQGVGRDVRLVYAEVIQKADGQVSLFKACTNKRGAQCSVLVGGTSC